MTKKDYEKVAKVVRGQVERVKTMHTEGFIDLDALRDREITLLNVRANLAEEFAYDNPRFDREKFKEACGI